MFHDRRHPLHSTRSESRLSRPTTVADADGPVPSVTIAAADCCQHCQRALERSELCLDEDYKWCCRPCWDHSIPTFDGGATPFLHHCQVLVVQPAAL